MSAKKKAREERLQAKKEAIQAQTGDYGQEEVKTEEAEKVEEKAEKKEKKEKKEEK